MISAAGNDGESEALYYPVSYDGVLVVGSHDKHQAVSDFSQQNGTADILASGEDIWLASRNGKTYGTKGTSYASAYVSAAAALLWEINPMQSADVVKHQLLTDAVTVDGWKILNRSLYSTDTGRTTTAE